MMPVQPQALPISLVILTWPCLAGLGGLGCLGWIDCFRHSPPVASLFPSSAVLHDVEELLLGVDAELGVDGPAMGVGGIARNVEFSTDEADIAAASEQGKDFSLARCETMLGCDLRATGFNRFRTQAKEQGRE